MKKFRILVFQPSFMKEVNEWIKQQPYINTHCDHPECHEKTRYIMWHYLKRYWINERTIIQDDWLPSTLKEPRVIWALKEARGIQLIKGRECPLFNYVKDGISKPTPAYEIPQVFLSFGEDKLKVVEIEDSETAEDKAMDNELRNLLGGHGISMN